MVWARPGAVRQLHWHLGIFLGRQRACPLEKKINKQQQQKTFIQKYRFNQTRFIKDLPAVSVSASKHDPIQP